MIAVPTLVVSRGLMQKRLGHTCCRLVRLVVVVVVAAVVSPQADTVEPESPRGPAPIQPDIFEICLAILRM